MTKRLSVRKAVALALMPAAAPISALAQEAPSPSNEGLRTIDEVVVTGSLIRGTPEDAALPVQVLTIEDLQKSGDPSALEFVKNLTASGPTTGESYYFSGSALTGNVRFNLRGIGSDKTLTLFNGRRAFDNANIYPSSVFERVEVLKDGAAVTYGADATGGVVNLITRRRFEGFETGGSYKYYKGSEEGEWKAHAVLGLNGENSNTLFAVEWDHRSELDSRERDFSSLPYWVNPAPSSTLTNLAVWVPRAAPAGPPDNTANGEFGAPLGAALDFNKASCEAVGGIFGGTNCAYNYIGYYNLVEKQDTYRLFGQFTTDVSDRSEFVMRALYAEVDLPHQYGSPSQPVIRGPARSLGLTHQLYVPITNPYVADFVQRSGWGSNPAFPLTAGFTAASYRAFAHGGNPTFASGDNYSVPNSNETKYWHITAGFNGEVTDSVMYDVGVTYNEWVQVNTQPDIIGYRLQEALNGFGGPNCNAPDLDPTRFGTQNPAMAGVGGCMWYNPFASNFAGNPVYGLANPSYVPGAENPPELVRWLFNDRMQEINEYSTTIDVVFSGDTPLVLPGGPVAWGAGLQWRETKRREIVPDPLYNGRQPCDWPGQDPAELDDPAFTGCTIDEPGPFLFFGTEIPDAVMQVQRSAFAEFSFPFFDSWNLTAAVRHEEFTGGLEATVYKFSTKWQITDALALRGSYGTNYQAPDIDIIPGEIDNGVNSYTIAGSAWRGARTITETDIEPETATVWSAGLITQFDWGAGHEFRLIVDYWDIETKDELGLLASANDIANSVFSIIPPGQTQLPTNGAALADCSHPLISRVTFNGGVCTQGVTTANDFASITTALGNGPGQRTAGFDVQLDYAFPAGPGRVNLGLELTKVEKFEFTETILDGYVLKPVEDRLGKLNFATVGFAAPEWRANFSANYSMGDHNFRAVVNYVSGVDDERFLNPDGSINLAAATPAGQQPGSTEPFGPSLYGIIGDDWVSGDLHYLWSAPWATIGVSIINVTDEDPPASRQEFGFDPRIGNALGRQFEISLRKSF